MKKKSRVKGQLSKAAATCSIYICEFVSVQLCRFTLHSQNDRLRNSKKKNERFTKTCQGDITHEH